MSQKVLVLLAVAFAVVALIAGGMQLAAFIASERPRHLVLAVFALAVGASVGAAAASALWRIRRRR
ncbi:hypothetical protein [Mycolicibacterium confluentis]|uniref:Uncharacterized protein n=1 Tax=Mycolicibacterium confluentis TaxID=28047 RepID=A0A7I7XS80_9MYCO|nr:hypothetical protein [Mycolicibacterium confluentis]MCV7321426.1 hypothetical protein [Mycolicibacterium confluentis]ORV33036.1 hypothetical protein AWB99_08430 [Mycolicibacterium confluentis]BBZ32090.1 hypothetical protein MCNF_06950 [Mycolicibacterium confluentis]